MRTAKLTRTVIDSSCLQSTDLRGYLAASKQNFALLTDYAAMEAYKGNTLVGIQRAMEVLVEFPGQVIVLKSTSVACGLSGKSAGLQRRLIDHPQTEFFKTFCVYLKLAAQGNREIQGQLLQKGRDAEEHLQTVLEKAAQLPGVIDRLAQEFTSSELQIIRSRSPWTGAILDKFVGRAFALAQQIFRTHPQAGAIPPFEEVPNTFIFRASVCSTVWSFMLFETGGAHGKKPQRLRNDMVDLSYATFATYFDGLMTLDRRLAAIHYATKQCVERMIQTWHN